MADCSNRIKSVPWWSQVVLLWLCTFSSAEFLGPHDRSYPLVDLHGELSHSKESVHPSASSLVPDSHEHIGFLPSTFSSEEEFHSSPEAYWHSEEDYPSDHLFSPYSFSEHDHFDDDDDDEGEEETHSEEATTSKSVKVTITKVKGTEKPVEMNATEVESLLEVQASPPSAPEAAVPMDVDASAVPVRLTALNATESSSAANVLNATESTTAANVLTAENVSTASVVVETTPSSSTNETASITVPIVNTTAETTTPSALNGTSIVSDDSLHAPSVETSQGPRVTRQDPTRRRPTRFKDERRVVRQGDGSLRSREAKAGRNVRSHAQNSRQDSFLVEDPVNEVTPLPKPKRRKVRKGSRKRTKATTLSPVPAEPADMPTPPPVALQAPVIPGVFPESSPKEEEPYSAPVPDFPEASEDSATENKETRPTETKQSLQPEKRVPRQEEAEESREVLQEASVTDLREARIPRQQGRRRPGSSQQPAVDFQQVDVNPDGSYRFAYNTNDEGEHFRVEQANKDNVVAGRYGYRDANGRPVQTVYTAGPRGFRARGPDIARKMDLSQAGGRAPRPPPDGRYSPEYDNYFDPLEDPSYSFAFRTPTYTRKEDADSRGDVTGVYSYYDDVGEKHVVKYEAGAEKGFNVLTAFPDNIPARGFHIGPGNPPRGRTSILQNRDGSYRFVAAGPDSRREEVSDQVNNRRGSYTYIDDKGEQRTVEYIAGPGIGYRVVNKNKGVILPPPYASGFPAFPSPTPTFSSFPSPFAPTLPSPSSSPSFPGPSSSSRPKPPYLSGGKRPANEYIPPRGSPGSSSRPQSAGDGDDLFSEIFPEENGRPVPSLRPTSRPTKKPSFSIDSSEDDFPGFPQKPTTTSFPGHTSTRPSTSFPASTGSFSGGGDNAIDDGLFGGGFGSSPRPSPGPKPTKRPKPNSGHGSTTTTTSASDEGFLDLFPTSGQSPPSTPRPSKRPRPKPRPTSTTARPPPGDDFDTLFNPTPIDTNPSDVPPRDLSTSSGYDYSKPKKPNRRPGGGSSGDGSGGSRPSSGIGGHINPTTIRPGRLPNRPKPVEDSDDFLSGGPGGGDGGFWSGRPQGGGSWSGVPYGNCCPGVSRLRPHHFEDVGPGGTFPPGTVIRAHVQSVDLMPYEPERADDPGEALERYIRDHDARRRHRQRSTDSSDAPSKETSTNSQLADEKN